MHFHLEQVDFGWICYDDDDDDAAAFGKHEQWRGKVDFDDFGEDGCYCECGGADGGTVGEVVCLDGGMIWRVV